MKIANYIDEEHLLLERPNIRVECNIQNDENMQKYIMAYNAYNNLLVQYFMKNYYLSNVDKEMEKHSNTYPEIDSSEKDLYQKSSEGYLKYFYIRNNIYIERLNQEQLNYLLSIYNSDDLSLDQEKEKFIETTYLDVILEKHDKYIADVNYGPDSLNFYKPNNSIIIGVRYNQFKNINNDKETLKNFAQAEGKLQVLTNFLEYKVKRKNKVPFYVIKYDDFSIKTINKKQKRVEW